VKVVAQRSNSMVDSRSKQICPECGSDRLLMDYNVAEMVCKSCGLVISDEVTDKGPEWRAFNKEQADKRRRVGDPVTFTMHDKGLSTTIDYRNKDAHGRTVPVDRRAQLYRMRKWQRRSRVSDSLERNLAIALSTMSKTCSTLRLPKSILETASIIYRKALERRLIRGRSIQGVAAASIYMACRKCTVARTLDEIAYVMGIDKKVVGRCYRFMVKELREDVPLSSPAYYVSRLANHLGITGHAETIAINLLNTAKQEMLTHGKAPIGIAAAAMYIASITVNDPRTQREIAEVVGITEVTIRNRYKDLVKNLDILISV
jgi:transcription initiation factor TFIIB